VDFYPVDFFKLYTFLFAVEAVPKESIFTLHKKRKL